MTFLPLSIHMHAPRQQDTSLFVPVNVPIKKSHWVQWNAHIKPLVFLTWQGLHLEEFVCVEQFQTFSKGFIMMVPFHSGYDSEELFATAKKFICKPFIPHFGQAVDIAGMVKLSPPLPCKSSWSGQGITQLVW